MSLYLSCDWPACSPSPLSKEILIVGPSFDSVSQASHAPIATATSGINQMIEMRRDRRVVARGIVAARCSAILLIGWLPSVSRIASFEARNVAPPGGRVNPSPAAGSYPDILRPAMHFQQIRRSLTAELRQSRAQRGAGDLEQPLERPVELDDQKNSTSNRQCANAEDSEYGRISRGEEPEAGEDDAQPEDQHHQECNGDRGTQILEQQ